MGGFHMHNKEYGRKPKLVKQTLVEKEKEQELIIQQHFVRKVKYGNSKED